MEMIKRVLASLILLVMVNNIFGSNLKDLEDKYIRSLSGSRELLSGKITFPKKDDLNVIIYIMQAEWERNAPSGSVLPSDVDLLSNFFQQKQSGLGEDNIAVIAKKAVKNMLENADSKEEETFESADLSVSESLQNESAVDSKSEEVIDLAVLPLEGQYLLPPVGVPENEVAPVLVSAPENEVVPEEDTLPEGVSSLQNESAVDSKSEEVVVNLGGLPLEDQDLSQLVSATEHEVVPEEDTLPEGVSSLQNELAVGSKNEEVTDLADLSAQAQDLSQLVGVQEVSVAPVLVSATEHEVVPEADASLETPRLSVKEMANRISSSVDLARSGFGRPLLPGNKPSPELKKPTGSDLPRSVSGAGEPAKISKEGSDVSLYEGNSLDVENVINRPPRPTGRRPATKPPLAVAFGNVVAPAVIDAPSQEVLLPESSFDSHKLYNVVELEKWLLLEMKIKYKNLLEKNLSDKLAYSYL